MPASPCRTTWDEVTAAAEKLKAGGMEHPIVYEYNQELPELLRRLRRAGLWPRRRSLRRGQQGDLRRSRQRRLQAAAMAADAFKKDLVQPGDARIEDHPVDEHRQARLHHRLQLRARRDEQRRRPAARRPVRSGADARRRARDARLHEVLRRSPRRRRRIRRAPRRPGSSSTSWPASPTRSPSAGRSRRASASASCSLFDDPDVHAAWNKWIDMQRARASRSPSAKAGTWTEWTLGLVGLFPPAARQGDGRRGDASTRS